MKSIKLIFLLCIFTEIAVVRSIWGQESTSLNSDVSIFLNPSKKSTIFSFKSQNEGEKALSSLFTKYIRVQNVGTNNIYTVKSETEMIFGWWTISTTDFRNPLRYPPVIVPTGDSLNIQVNIEGFRLNATVNCQDKSKPPEDIWFFARLNDVNLYYSATQTDLNILGSLSLDSITGLIETKSYFKERQLFCFETRDKFSKNWKMCHFDLTTYNLWITKLKKAIKSQ